MGAERWFALTPFGVARNLPSHPWTPLDASTLARSSADAHPLVRTSQPGDRPKMTATANISAATTTLKEQVGSRPIRVAIICDFAEEQWPSMDLVGNMLHATLSSRFVDSLDATLLRPALPFDSTTKLSRIFGRFLHYPRELRRIRDHFDVFHIVDHSYAHLAHHLPH